MLTAYKSAHAKIRMATLRTSPSRREAAAGGQIEDLHSITRIDAVPAERLQALVVVALEARKERESGSLEFRRGLPPVCADTPNARTLLDTEMSVSREHGTRIGLPEHPDSGLRPALVPTL